MCSAARASSRGLSGSELWTRRPGAGASRGLRASEGLLGPGGPAPLGTPTPGARPRLLPCPPRHPPHVAAGLSATPAPHAATRGPRADGGHPLESRGLMPGTAARPLCPGVPSVATLETSGAHSTRIPESVGPVSGGPSRGRGKQPPGCGAAGSESARAPSQPSACFCPREIPGQLAEQVQP